MSYFVHTISFPLPAAEDDCIVHKCSAKGGKVTVTDFYVTNHATTTGTATFTAALHKRSSAGTVISGTVSTLGGTADHWVDTLPKSGTLDADYIVLDEGECLSLSYAAVGGGSHTSGYATIHYVMGR
jgi:hypothetical protein